MRTLESTQRTVCAPPWLCLAFNKQQLQVLTQRTCGAVTVSTSTGTEDFTLYSGLWWHSSRFYGLTAAADSTIRTAFSYNIELTALPTCDVREFCRNIKVRCSSASWKLLSAAGHAPAGVSGTT